MVRPLRPDDREAMVAAFEETGPTTRFLRFLRPVDHLSERELDHLLAVDHRDRAAWVAIEPESGRGLGIARYFRDEDAPHRAEAAVVVVDADQGRGIGRILLRLLTETALANGIEEFAAFVHAENQTMVKALDRVGASVERDGTALKLSVRLPPDDFGDSVLLDMLRAVARGDIRPAAPRREGPPA